MIIIDFSCTNYNPVTNQSNIESAVLVGDAVVIGAENETSSWNEMPFCKVSRTSQVYLPHILRELLKRK